MKRLVQRFGKLITASFIDGGGYYSFSSHSGTIWAMGNRLRHTRVTSRTYRTGNLYHRDNSQKETALMETNSPGDLDRVPKYYGHYV